MSQIKKSEAKQKPGVQTGIQMTKSDHNKLMKSVVTKLSPDKLSDVAYTGEGKLTESLVLLVGGKTSMSTQFTIHRPIGITRLEKDDWVMTPTTEVNYLVAREKNPEALRIADVRSRNRLNFLVGKGLLIVKEDIGYYATVLTKSRKAFLEEAEAKAKAKKDKDKYAYLPEEVKALEREVSKALKTPEGVAAVEVGVDDTYETMGGVMENIPQMAVPAFRGKKPFELGALIPKLMMTNIGLGKGAEVTVVVNPTKAKDEEEEAPQGAPTDPNPGLVQEIEQLEFKVAALENYARQLLTVAQEVIPLLGPDPSAPFLERVRKIQSDFQEELSSEVADMTEEHLEY